MRVRTEPRACAKWSERVRRPTASLALLVATGCQPKIVATDGTAEGTGGGTSSTTGTSGPSDDTAMSSETGSGSGSGTAQPSCAPEADYVFGDACYRAFELSERSRWGPHRVAPIRMRGGPNPELVVPLNGVGTWGQWWDGPGDAVILEFDGDTIREVELEWPSNAWPPHPVDLDNDGSDEGIVIVYAGTVAVLDYDPQVGNYTTESLDGVLPPMTHSLRAAVDADGDGASELIACSWFEGTTDEELVVVSREGNAWVDVGASFPFFHPDFPPPVKVLSSGKGTTLLGLLDGELDHPLIGQGYYRVTLVRVTPELELKLDAVLESGTELYDIKDFTAADVDGDGDLDIVLAGEKPTTACAVYLRDDDSWNGPDVFEGCRIAASVGDVTNDDVAEILYPSRAVDYVSGTHADLQLDAGWPIGAVDINGDRPRELLYLPSTTQTGSEPSPLHLLLSIPTP